MSRDPLSRRASEVRRKDRAIEDDGWIREFLARTAVGILATEHDGLPFMNSNTFIYDVSTHSIYIHTAKTGRTRSNVELGGER